MFRIFLRKKLHSGRKTKKRKLLSRGVSSKNRRLFARYQVDQQHLTVMNDQDILVIRDISAKGFCSDVSLRAYERFEMNDVYAARMRYHGDVQDIQVKVAWKRQQQVGFELYKPDEKMLNFFRSLLRPIELANSLSQVDAAFMRDLHAGLVWFHGEDADLHIWLSDEEGLSAWQLIADNHIVEWSSVHGLKTGCIKHNNRTELGILEPGEAFKVMDPEADAQRVRLALDVMIALPFPERSDLVKTLDERAG
ncbi:MAG: hypothetical protein M3Q07_22470 [Pseudobdellovibrionaceae bacterium]|nr:hypothetical protein [Pseudobdellovibrionaceae bacterium]